MHDIDNDINDNLDIKWYEYWKWSEFVWKNRTWIVGPSECGKTYLLFNQLINISIKLGKLVFNEIKIQMVTRSNEQNEDQPKLVRKIWKPNIWWL